MSILLVDGSYNAFYRIHATIAWYKFSHPEEKIDDDYNWMENSEFVSKIEKMYFKALEKIIKKHSIDKGNIYFCLDCPRKDIWRMKLMDEYKGTRKNNKNLGNIFQFIYKEIIPKLIMEKKIKKISFNHAEADDIIAVIKKNLRNKNEKQEIIIVANDHDYLQLLDDHTYLYNLKNKLLNDKSSGDSEQDLFLKIVLGDGSDNIKKVFNRCGKKTALKYFNDRELF
ncbi:unnamed protein product, partial [marine sediment metagenome]